MTLTDFERFCEILEPLGDLFDKPLTPTMLKMYFAALGRLDIAQVEAAVIEWAQTGKYFPKPVEIIEAATGKGEDRALSAWSLFTEAVRCGGHMKSLYSADACFVSAIKRTFGNWVKACEMLPGGNDDTMFASMRNTFVAAYQIALREGATEHYLTGRAEMENASKGGLQAMVLAGKQTYQQDVICVVNGKVTLKKADFSTQTGRLIDAEILALPGMQPDENDPRQLLATQTMRLISEKTM